MGVQPRMSRPFLGLPVVLCAALLGVAGCSGGGTTATTATIIPAATATLPLLVTWHSGGYSFQVGTADNTAGLIVALANYRDFFHGRIPEVSVLPDPRWRARVIIGHDLRFWGPGGDPTDPPPVVEEEWPVVAGTITILEMASIHADCGPDGLARALFEDFAARAPDGTIVYLGDFEARNEHWGCLGA
jgi:hypothetical protein